MKTGIILLFSNNEQEIKDTKFNNLKSKGTTKYCFVNNASNDKTLEKLKEIKENNLKNISIIDVKKNKGLHAAVKAGVRHLKNNGEFNPIVYLEFSKYSNHKKLEKILDSFINKKKIINFISNNSSRNILRNVFALEQIIK